MINSPSVLATLAPPSPAAAPGGTWLRVPRRGLKRPRGLWKARRRLEPATTATTSSLTQHQHQLSQTPGSGGAKSCSSGRGSDTDREMESCGEGEGEDEEDGDDDGDDMSQNSNSSKRQRRDSGGGSSTSSNNNKNHDYNNSIPMELWAVYVDSEADVGGAMDTRDRLASTCGAGGHGIPPGENSETATARRAAPLISNMATTSIAERAPPGATKETYEYSDWEEIKEMLTWASELCDRDDPSGSLPFIRAVVHECHRFLVRFPDPSLFFSRPSAQGRRRGRSTSPESVLVSEERPWNEPTLSRRSTTPESDTSQTQQLRHRLHHHHHPVESPTALHAVLGVALFLFGNVIAQNPSLALPREPTTPSPYWLAALDVLNAGDSLPCQTNGTHAYSSSSYDDDDAGSASASADDWRVAIAWGRTLVALAYEATKRASSPSPPPSPATARVWLPPAPASPHSPTPSPTSSSPPRYQPRSPLAAIATLRTPGVIHAARASAPELLTLAADQFSRGIFHMPHNNPQPHRYCHPNSSSHTLSPAPSTPSSSPSGAAAQRPHVLFTLASEVLAVAERLGDAEARRRWAKWADEVFLQMHMEADVAAWRARVGVARGRCWLVTGNARADEMENVLERGGGNVLLSKEAEDARASFSTAISFFDRAKKSASSESSEPSLVNMQPWFTEALLSMANLTADEEARESLYVRAQVEDDDAVARELNPRATRTPRSRPRNVDVQMDES